MLIWTSRAVQDLEDVHAYIAADSEDAANRVLLHIRDTVGMLELHPLLGRVSRYTARS